MRQATADDMSECLRMAHSFTQAAGLESDDDSLTITLEHLLSNGGLFVVGSPAVAMAGVLIYDNYMKRSEKAAQELFWWVDESARGSGAGRKLLKGLESHARDQGAKSLTMIALDDLDGERVAKLYSVSGYRPLERSFRKVL